MTYLDFLRTKVEVAPVSGFAVTDDELSPALKPHQRDAAKWAQRAKPGEINRVDDILMEVKDGETD